MTISRPSELHDFLRSQGLKAKKGCSQNFLIDGNIIRKIAAAASVTSEDIVIEIGSGPGALTEQLLLSGARVIAIEMDPQLAKALLRLQTPDNRLQVFEEDILKFPLESFLQKTLAPGTKAKVVANLPYHITTPILAKLMLLHSLLESLTLMVQKEVAERFVAEKNTKNYSSFTVFLQHYGTAKYCFTVNRTCFFPRPSIQSAIVHLTLKAPPPIEKEEQYFQMVRGSFQQRRKMMRSSLKDLYAPEKIEAGLRSLGLNPEARPEQLSWDNFIQLHQLLI